MFHRNRSRRIRDSRFSGRSFEWLEKRELMAADVALSAHPVDDNVSTNQDAFVTAPTAQHDDCDVQVPEVKPAP